MQFPNKTYFNTKIAKKKFYENLEIAPALKKLFVEQIDSIYWTNKLSVETINADPGDDVQEIEVIEILISGDTLDEAVLRLIDKGIPYHILFVLTKGDISQACIGFKEKNASNNTYKVVRYYKSAWMPKEEIPLVIDGINMDAIYENFVKQLAGDQLQSSDNTTLKDSVELQGKLEKLQAQADKLERMARKEIEPRKKFELYQEIQNIKKQIEDTVGGK